MQMATTKFYLDTRRMKKDGTYPMKICIQFHNKTIYYSTGISLAENQWSKDKVVNHPQKTILTNYLRTLNARVGNILLEIEVSSSSRSYSASAVLNIIKGTITPQEEEQPVRMDFYAYAEVFINTKEGRTKEIYENTITKMKKWYSVIPLEEMDVDWLNSLVSKLHKIGNKTNTVAIDLRNIRAIYNYASSKDKSLRAFYPFADFSIDQEETEYRTLVISDLVSLWFIGKQNKEYEEAVDYFLLMFYLIGINSKDLCYLRKAEYRDGSIHYKRAKTKKLYNISVCHFADEIIKKHLGTDDLLLNILENYADYRGFTRHLNLKLHEVGNKLGLHNNLTTYYARYTWANIAHRLGINKDVISMSLGHSFGAKVTDIYIDYDSEQVNEANNIVISNFNLLILIRLAEPYLQIISNFHSIFILTRSNGCPDNLYHNEKNNGAE